MATEFVWFVYTTDVMLILKLLITIYKIGRLLFLCKALESGVPRLGRYNPGLPYPQGNLKILA